jgi:hypothetical protein
VTLSPSTKDVASGLEAHVVKQRFFVFGPPRRTYEYALHVNNDYRKTSTIHSYLVNNQQSFRQVKTAPRRVETALDYGTTDSTQFASMVQRRPSFVLQQISTAQRISKIPHLSTKPPSENLFRVHPGYTITTSYRKSTPRHKNVVPQLAPQHPLLLQSRRR